MIVGNGVAGLWALAAHARPKLRVAPLWWLTIAAQVATFLQAIVGVAHMNVDGVEPTEFHVLYGFSALVAVGVLYAYRAQLVEKQYLLYGCGGLFIMGLGLRELALVG
ncbi:MAG: hypothetical protein GXY13_06155 [Acidimicrobiales bacterium]|nr:hypothetical protein [Acidimicrobiales bacterium]